MRPHQLILDAERQRAPYYGSAGLWAWRLGPVDEAPTPAPQVAQLRPRRSATARWLGRSGQVERAGSANRPAATATRSGPETSGEPKMDG